MANINITKQLFARQIGKHTDIESSLLQEWCSKLQMDQFDIGGIISEDDTARCLDVDPNGNFVITGSSKGCVSLFHANYDVYKSTSFKVIYNINKLYYLESVESVKWIPNILGLFVFGGKNKKLTLWDFFAVREIDQIYFTSEINQIAISSVGGVSTGLISVSMLGEGIKLVDMKSGYAVQELEGLERGSMSCAWSTKSEYLLAAGGFGSVVKLWDIRVNKSPLAKFKTMDNTNELDPVTGVIFTSDGKRLLTACRSVISCWDSKYNSKLYYKYDPIKNNRCKAINFHVSEYGNMEVGVVPSGNNIEIFNTKTGKMITSLSGHEQFCNGVHYNMERKELYSVGDDNYVFRWSYESDALRDVIP